MNGVRAVKDSQQRADSKFRKFASQQSTNRTNLSLAKLQVSHIALSIFQKFLGSVWQVLL